MSISTDIEVNWINTIDTSNKIGLSKPLNQLSVDIFNSAEFCVGYKNKALKLTKESDSYPKSTDAGANNVPFYISDNMGYTKNTANAPDGVYYRTILFAVPINFTWGWDANVRADNSIVRIVTKLNLQKNKLYLTTAETAKNALTTAPVYRVNESLTGTTADGTFLVDGVSYYINCADVYLTESGYYIKFQTFIDNMYDNFNAQYGEGILGNFNYNINSSTMFSASPVMFSNADYKVLIQGSEPNAYMIQNWNNTELDITPDIDNTDIKFFATYNIVSPYYWHTYLRYSVEYALLISASYGLFFEWNNVQYKPVIQNGLLTGYTNDMKVPSDIDNWSDVSGHNISPTPPTPTPDAKDNEIDVSMQQFAPAQCFVNYIEMSTENMIKLASGFNSYNASIWNIGGDLMKNLISYKIFAAYGKHSGTIKNVSIGGHEIEYNDSPINGNYIDDMGTIDLGSVEIGSKFKFNDWRDYAPYTKIECFVPCCGWCQLPPWCMGRTVTGTLYIDISNGSCKAVIKAGKTPVAEIGGCVAMDVPFSSVATGAKAAGIITAITNGAVAAFNPTPQNLISGSFGILSSLNANYTETKGVMGDGSNINGCTDFLIKVTRPASTDTGTGQITDRYKHEKGIPCAKTKTLASGQGFTQVMDANINGTMTDREKQMIIDGFRHGLIL